MPTTEQSRVFRLVWTSYAVLAMTDPELAEKPFVEGPNRFEQQLADVLGRARTEGELAPGLDVSAEAALAALRYHLDSVFGASGKARDSSTSATGVRTRSGTRPSERKRKNPFAGCDCCTEALAWLFTRYAEVKAVLRDPRLSRAATGLPTPPPARRYRVSLTRGRSCG